MHKKAQAAMEFLMTYGWAILVVLVAIGALAYFGVLNPSRFLPNSCTIAPGLSCDAFKVNVDDTVELSIRNGMGKDLTIVGVNINATGVACTTPVTGESVADGAVLDLTGAGNSLAGCSVGAVGSRFRGDVIFTYTADGLSHTARGNIIAQVE